MASCDNDHDSLRLRSREVENVSSQGRRCDRKGKGGGNKKPCTRKSKIKKDRRGSASKDKNKDGAPSQKRSGSKRSNNTSKISKRRCLKKPHPRPHFIRSTPEAEVETRVVQSCNDAYIYDYESEHDDVTDGGQNPIRAIATATVAVPEWLQQMIQQQQQKEERMKGKAKTNHGHGRSRCHCFNCWWMKT